MNNYINVINKSILTFTFFSFIVTLLSPVSGQWYLSPPSMRETEAEDIFSKEISARNFVLYWDIFKNIFTNLALKEELLQIIPQQLKGALTKEDVILWLESIHFVSKTVLHKSALYGDYSILYEGQLPNKVEVYFIVKIKDDNIVSVSVKGIDQGNPQPLYEGAEYYQIPPFINGEFAAAMEERLSSLPYKKRDRGWHIFNPWIENVQDVSIFEKALSMFLDDNPVVDLFLERMARYGIRLNISQSYLITKRSHGVFLHNNTMYRYGFPPNDISAYLFEFCNSVFNSFTEVQKNTIEDYFMNNHNEFIRIYSKEKTFGQEAFTRFLIMALNGRRVDFVYNGGLILHDEDIDFFFQTGIFSDKLAERIKEEVHANQAEQILHIHAIAAVASKIELLIKPNSIMSSL